MSGSQQVWPPVTVNRIVQTLIYRLALSRLLKLPLLRNIDGSPVAITKYRNFDGFELLNPDGLTLSIFPYHYTTSDQASIVTVESDNVGLRFEPHTLGGPDPDKPHDEKQDLSANDLATVNIILKLHAFGYSQEANQDGAIVPEQETTFEMNYIEWKLRQYAELVAAALRGREMRRLPSFPHGIPLVANSFVKRIDYSTSAWATNANLVLHSASILWQAKYYVPREWDLPAQWVPALMDEGNLIVGQIPGPVAIFYDTLQHRFLDAGGAVVARDALDDPSTSEPYTTLDVDLISLIDTAPRSAFDFSMYFKRIEGAPSDC